jgi:Putative metal-binding motif
MKLQTYIFLFLLLSSLFFIFTISCDGGGSSGDDDGGEDNGFLTYYLDSDGDGYGDPNISIEATSRPDSYVSNDLDCNDSNLNIYPGASEICGDGIDQDCNGSDLSCPPTTYYRDSDGDGYGDPNNSINATSLPVGYVLDNTDCDDMNAYISPEATEVCSDNIDNNCDGIIDEAGCYSSPGVWTLISVYYYDYDAEDRLIRETHDNNANNVRDNGDITWNYEYDTEGLQTGYLKYEGNPGSSADPDGIGTCIYDTNGCNNRLEEETFQGTNLQVWTYTVDSECNRLSYEYDGNGTTETGTYYRDGDGNVIELRLGNSDYWEYTLDANGGRLRYDFYENDTLLSYGFYDYAGGRLDELRNYERR